MNDGLLESEGVKEEEVLERETLGVRRIIDFGHAT